MEGKKTDMWQQEANKIRTTCTNILESFAYRKLISTLSSKPLLIKQLHNIHYYNL
jgi:hypothetical protein